MAHTIQPGTETSLRMKRVEATDARVEVLPPTSEAITDFPRWWEKSTLYSLANRDNKAS